MTAQTRHHPSFSFAAAVVLLVAAAGLGGCAGMSDGMSTAFADPAKYELYDCKQLETARKALAARTAELQGLMAKAETGAAGTVVAELAYRNEYIAVRGQVQIRRGSLAEQPVRRRRAVFAAAAPVPPVIAPAPAPKALSRADLPVGSMPGVHRHQAQEFF